MHHGKHARPSHQLQAGCSFLVFGEKAWKDGHVRAVTVTITAVASLPLLFEEMVASVAHLRAVVVASAWATVAFRFLLAHTGLPALLVAAVLVVVGYRLLKKTARFAAEIAVVTMALVAATELGLKLEDLKIIISGGAQGMGRHFALRLAEAGAQVAVCDVNEVGLAETLEAGKGKPGKIHAKRVNVADEKEIAELSEKLHIQT